MKNKLRELWDYRYMLTRLVGRELRGKYKGSVLGVLWTFVNPLLQVIVYTIVFSNILRSGLENYSIYLIVGIMPWFFFNNSTMQGLGSIRYQGDMVKKIYFPKEVLPLATVFSNLVTFFLSLIIVYLFLLGSGVGVKLELQIWIPIIIFEELLVTIGLTLILAALEVYFRDLEYIFGVIMMIWMYLTPVFYSADILPAELEIISKVNPMFRIIEMYHDVLYYQVRPHNIDLIISLISGFVLLIIGEIMFNAMEDGFAEEL